MAIIYKMPYLIKAYLLVFMISALFMYFGKGKSLKEIALLFFPFLYIVYMIGTMLFPILIPPVGVKEWIVTYDLTEILKYKSLQDLLLYLRNNLFLFFPLPIIFRIFQFQRFSKLTYTVKFVFFFSIIVEVLKGIKGAFGFSTIIENPNINNIILSIIGAILGWVVFSIYLNINKE